MTGPLVDQAGYEFLKKTQAEVCRAAVISSAQQSAKQKPPAR
jgi:hypothetical protein